MYISLHLCPSGRRNATHRVYEYQFISDDSVKIRVTTDTDMAEALIDLDTLERIKKEVFQIYIFRNSMKKPYLMLGIKGGKIMISRFIMGLTKNDKLVVDHLNGDTLDNRKKNLKVVTRRDNSRNRKQVSNQQGFKGVRKAYGTHFRRTGIHKYQAMLILGTYDTPEEAAQVYKEAHQKLFPGVMHDDKW